MEKIRTGWKVVKVYRVGQASGDIRRAYVDLQFESEDGKGSRQFGDVGKVHPRFESFIVAIPDLLVAAQSALASLEQARHDGEWGSDGSEELLRAAISKAEGK